MMRPLLAASALAISMHAPLVSAEAPPSIPYEKYRLANGLEVILSQDRTLPLVAVDVWYHVGAANEEPGRTGFAHLFEHMMFTGSKHVPRGVADKLLEGVGGTDSNATTSFDRTNYFDTVPSNPLELALWIDADRMGYLLDSLEQAALVTPAPASEKRLTVTDQIELERLDLAWLTAPKFKPGDAELTIAGYILAGGKSSRLYKKLVYDLQIAQEVSAGQDANALTSIFEIEAIARSGHTAAELQPLIDAELDRLAAEAPTEAEVEAARNQIERSLYQSLQKVGGSNGRADLLNMYNHYTGDPGYLPKDIERYARVTPNDVQRIVRDSLRKDARVVVLAVRGDKKLDPDPPAPEIARNPGTEAINAHQRWRTATPQAGPTRP